MEDATCSLPQDLINTAWEYNYTNVKDNTEQSTTLNFATTTLQSSAINLDAKGTTIDDWTCINSLGISDTEAVVVFKSDNSFSDGPFAGSQWLYLCMKLTKVTTDLYYFYLLSDTFTGVSPDERVFASSEGNPPNNNDPVCSTFCQYTESPNIRTLQKPGTHDALPNDASLCKPCGSSCKVATTEMTPKETTQKTTIPPTSSEIDTTIEITFKETTQITSKPTTSTKVNTITTTKQSTETTPVTSQPTTSTEIDTIATKQSTETTPVTSHPTTATEVKTITPVQSTETTQITTIHSTEQSTEIESFTDMTSTDTTKKTTIPTTSTEFETTTEVETTTKSPEITLPPISTAMETSTETTTKETKQTTTTYSTAVALETTHLTSIPSISKDTDTTTDLKIATTNLKVETTLETLVTDTELLKRYSGPIIVGGLAIFGFVLVIIVFILLKGRSMIGTERITNNKDQELCGVIPETCYIYKGKDCGFQKIAIQHWDNH
ncbi:Hypothetical predicted protein [Mytilus galloprovincialis]|uniref:Uncharacterized protein n=1 Tax=Mytilus galloprovincialis TaxID=29158 RepID=A0A8B6FJB3_MYTGA|nr:Hypothetical predicted protein [Mytilus galloprovincialis]